MKLTILVAVLVASSSLSTTSAAPQSADYGSGCSEGNSRDGPRNKNLHRKNGPPSPYRGFNHPWGPFPQGPPGFGFPTPGSRKPEFGRPHPGFKPPNNRGPPENFGPPNDFRPPNDFGPPKDFRPPNRVPPRQPIENEKIPFNKNYNDTPFSISSDEEENLNKIAQKNQEAPTPPFKDQNPSSIDENKTGHAQPFNKDPLSTSSTFNGQTGQYHVPVEEAKVYSTTKQTPGSTEKAGIDFSKDSRHTSENNDNYLTPPAFQFIPVTPES